MAPIDLFTETNSLSFSSWRYVDVSLAVRCAETAENEAAEANHAMNGRTRIFLETCQANFRPLKEEEEEF